MNSDIHEIFTNICKIKKMMIELRGTELKNAKKNFYSQNILNWQLDLFWEYIWGDKELDEIKKILFRR